MSQNILIEVSHQDQIFVENECSNKGYTLSGFFKILIEQYKASSGILEDDLKLEIENDEKEEKIIKKARKSSKKRD